MFNEIVSYTTRPPRSGEIDGVSYHFISDVEFEKQIYQNKMLEYAKFNDWLYGTSLEGLSRDKINIGVFNPAGIYQLKKRSDVRLQVFYVQACPKLRLMRQLDREDDPNVDEIMRRYKTDELDFLNLSFDYTPLTNEKESDLRVNALNILDRVR